MFQRQKENSKLKIGSQAPYFSLQATDGKLYSISDFVGKSALVIIFTANHCPIAQSYEERICNLVKLYRPRGVEFVAICSNDPLAFPEDDFEHMVEKSKRLNFAYLYLQDKNQVVAQAYDAACTPEVYLFDENQCLQYHGRIDDNPARSDLVTRNDLAQALEAVLSGKTPEVQLTSIFGCAIKWKPT